MSETILYQTDRTMIILHYLLGQLAAESQQITEKVVYLIFSHNLCFLNIG